MNITPFQSPSARKSHEELVLALGTENNPSQWMVFMETVERLLPELNEQGRLPKEILNRTLVGQLGFSSWKDYVESKNGLNWKIGGWNAYRRAWSTVKQAPYLRAKDVKAGWINSLSRKLAKADQELPETNEELDTWLEQQEQEKATAAESKRSALLERVTELEAQTAKLEKLVIRLEGENAALELQREKSELELQVRLGEKDQQLAAKEKNNLVLQNEIKSLKTKAEKPHKISIMEALKRIFRL
ncbi:hypothetical protein AB4137_00270 [Vibrio breoganii]